MSAISTRQPPVPTRPLHTGLREAPGERKGLSLKDWAGKVKMAATGGGVHAQQ